MATLVNFSWVRPGRLAAMGYPHGAPWEGLREQGVGAILTLTEHPLAVDPAGEGFAALHVPLVDFGTPALEDLQRCVAWISERLAEDTAVVVHCLAGVGRTGTVIAAWMVDQGMSPDEAIEELRSLRPGSLETRGQVDVVHRFAGRRKA